MVEFNLETTIVDQLLSNPVYNASGCWCTSYEELNQLVNSEGGAVVSKSSTVEPRTGNPEPRRYLDSYGSVNSMGVPNFGFKYYGEFFDQVDKKLYIQSVIPFSLEELRHMLIELNDKPRTIELNLSCPNIINKSIVAYDPITFENYLSELRALKLDKLTIGLKLPPYYEKESFIWVSDLIREYKDVIRFITCINSVVDGLIVEDLGTAIYPKNGFGGIGGMYCKPTALANVRRFYVLIGDIVEIIGCGGVRTGRDVFEHILCGASAVQVGTELVREGPEIFKRLNQELIQEMKKYGFNKLNDFKGNLRETPVIQ